MMASTMKTVSLKAMPVRRMVRYLTARDMCQVCLNVFVEAGASYVLACSSRRTASNPAMPQRVTRAQDELRDVKVLGSCR